MCHKLKNARQVYTWRMNATLVLHISHGLGIAEDTNGKWIYVFCNAWKRTYR